MSTTSLLGNVRRLPVTFERGEGMRLFDTEGRSYLDMLSGVAVCALGHSHPALTKAITEQTGKVLHVSNLFYTPEAVQAADAIVGLLGAGSVYFCNSGTEANEAAIKAVRKHAWRNGDTGRTQIVVLEGSFHGRTLGSLAATVQPAKWVGFGPLPGGFVTVPYEDAGALERVVGDRTAAIMIEPIQGESGIRPLTPAYAQTARRLATERGALLVADEIQTGAGRTGRWWGCEHLGITADVVTMAKGIGGGYPVGAMWLSEAVSGALQPGDHSTTQGGGPVACAAVLAVVRTIAGEGLIANADEMGKHLAAKLAPLGAEVRGAGLLLALELGRPAASAVVTAALRRGLIVNDVTPTAIRLAPPLIVTSADIDEAVDILAAAIEECG